ncbi:MAG: hypothetical protein KBT48_02890 [Firmicutes bacterium]|nr:hypothetical protein [Bacillota bacterium]
MSTVKDRQVIDFSYENEGNLILEIVDDMEWGYTIRNEHAHVIQDKINDYIGYILSGQANKDLPVIIKLVAEYPISQYGLDFLERIKTFLNKKNICDLIWSHSSEDGFSDDFEVDLEKVYPRLRKNWAENPQEDISLMTYEDNDYKDIILFGAIEGYVGSFVQDMGDCYIGITYNLIPEDYDVQQLMHASFKNLNEQIQYRRVESKEEGIFGIVAGGNFEAESIFYPDIWNQNCDDLNDDLVICIPTKDIVYLTKKHDLVKVNRMKEMAKNMFETNEKESPFLLMSKDVLEYSRESQEFKIIGSFM